MKVPSTCTLLLFAIAFLHISGNVGRADVSDVGAINQSSATSNAPSGDPTTTSAEGQPTPTSDAAQGQQSTQTASSTEATASPTTSAEGNNAPTTTPADNKNGQQTTTNDQSQTSQTNKNNDSPDKTSNTAAGPTGGSSSSDSGSGQGGQSGSTQENGPDAPGSSGSSNSSSDGPGTGVIVGAVVGGVAGIAIIGALALWLVRRGRNNHRNQGFQHQPDDYAISMSGTGAAPGYMGASAKSPFQQQQPRPFIPPSSAGYANLATVQPYEDYNNYQHYHDKPEERDMGADYYNSAQQLPGYYYPDETATQATAKPDEPTVQHKPNVV